jgi:hypothetical protein
MRDIVIRYRLPYEAHLASLIRLGVPPYEATSQGLRRRGYYLFRRQSISGNPRFWLL